MHIMHYSPVITFHLLLLCTRDVSSVELLQKYHQGIRSEIEARGAKFTDCIDLGKALMTRKHRDSAEVRLGQKRLLLFIFGLLLSLDLITFLGAIVLVWHKRTNGIAPPHRKRTKKKIHSS